MKCLNFLLFATPLLLLNSLAAAQVLVSDIITAGESCPQGSVQAQLAPDGSAFSVLYDRLVLSTTPDARDRQTNCTVSIRLSKPANLGITIESADFRGFVSLDKGLVAEQQIFIRAMHNQAGGAFSQLLQQSFIGPIQQDYILSTAAPTEAKNIFNCANGKMKSRLVIRTNLRIRGPLRKGQGYFSVDSVDGKMKQTYRLKYHYCK